MTVVAAGTTVTASTLVLRDANANISANNFLPGYTTTVTAAGTTTLTVGSAGIQYFTGGTTQTVKLPVTSTLVTGQQFNVTNNSTGNVTVQASGGSLVRTLTPLTTGVFIDLLTSGTGSTSWDYRVSGAIREILIASRTYYVATTGIDSNDGLSASTPFLTVQRAVDVIYGLDCVTYSITIQIADGTYAPASGSRVAYFPCPILGSGVITIQGNPGTPTNVILSSTSTQAIEANIQSITVKDVKLTTTTSGNCLGALGGATISFSGVDFGTCAGIHIKGNAAFVTATGNYTVSGGAQYHAFASVFAYIFLANRTITFSNSPNYSISFATATFGNMALTNMTFTNGNTVTGVRYQSQQQSFINTNGGGATYLPGDTAGSVILQGIYQ